MSDAQAESAGPSRSGGCLCGAVRFTLAETPTAYGACHCGMCRRFSGGIELGVMVPPGGLVFEREDGLRVYASSDWAERGFCGICGSSLFWRLTAPSEQQGLMSLSVGALDSMEGLAFESEVFIDQKPASHAFAGERQRMTEAEVMAMVGGDAAPEAGEAAGGQAAGGQSSHGQTGAPGGGAAP